jgi:hypothetical protein
VTIEEGWARPNTRGNKMRHYFIMGRSLCRVWGAYPGMKLDQERKPAQECMRCQKTYNRTVLPDQRRVAL